MNREDFNSLKVGDTFQLGEVKYVITEICSDNKFPGFSGSNLEIKRFVHCGIKSDCISMSYVCGGSNITTTFVTSYHMKDIQLISQEQNSIEHFQKKIEDTKSELVRLETTLKGLEDSKRMKELTETLSNLIVGDFYTIKIMDNTFTGKLKGNANNVCGSLVFDTLTIDRIITKRHIKQIIHRPNFSNEYRILLKKIDTFNSDLENA